MTKEQKIRDLKHEITILTNRNLQLNKDCCKYRIALNRIAHAKSWGIREGYHIEIATRALVIGEVVSALPDGAAIITENKTTNTPTA